LICFANGGDCRDNNYCCGQDCYASKQPHDSIPIRRRSAPERDHASIEPERHRRGFFACPRCSSQQPIDLIVLHCFSFAEIFASCCFIFCRARNARTLTSAALQPVILRISSIERPCKYSKSIANRSTGLRAVKRCSTSWREANRWSGGSSPDEVARFSTTASSSSLKSPCRN